MEPLGGFANFTAEELAAETFVSVRTARRWRRMGKAPTLALRWLELRHYGALETLHAAWQGWHVRAGQLHHPDGWTFTPAELTAIPLRYQELSALRCELDQHRRERDARERRPQPPILLRGLGGRHVDLIQHRVSVSSAVDQGILHIGIR